MERCSYPRTAGEWMCTLRTDGAGVALPVVRAPKNCDMTTDSHQPDDHNVLRRTAIANRAPPSAAKAKGNRGMRPAASRICLQRLIQQIGMLVGTPRHDLVRVIDGLRGHQVTPMGEPEVSWFRVGLGSRCARVRCRSECLLWRRQRCKFRDRWPIPGRGKSRIVGAMLVGARSTKTIRAPGP